jgi:hypothetical protein
VSEIRGLTVADRAGQALERGVGGDLQRLGRARVLGVLEHLLLAAGAAQEVKRGLADGQHLAEHVLPEADHRRHRAGAGVQLAEPLRDRRGVPASLGEVLLQGGPVAAAGRHGNLGLEHANESVLAGPGLGQVLHDLLLRGFHASSDHWEGVR